MNTTVEDWGCLASKKGRLRESKGTLGVLSHQSPSWDSRAWSGAEGLQLQRCGFQLQAQKPQLFQEDMG